MKEKNLHTFFDILCRFGKLNMQRDSKVGDQTERLYKSRKLGGPVYWS